ncbi:MAG: hypothetical protein IPO98_19210 [Saprospiraceae bacterium]|nr:hypothetical protein [Saprospiraceae bacterium]
MEWQSYFAENIEVTPINPTNKGKVNTAPNTVNYQIQRHIESWWVDTNTDSDHLEILSILNSGGMWTMEALPLPEKVKLLLPKRFIIKRCVYKMTMTINLQDIRPKLIYCV